MKVKQIRLARYTNKDENLLPNLLELQKRSFEEFLQKDVPLEEKKLTGIHYAFVETFGMAGCSNLYIRQLPQEKSKENKAIEILTEYSKKGVQDIRRIIQYKLPVLKNVKNSEIKRIKSQLEELGVECEIQSSGVVVKSGDTTIILQYNGYKLTDPVYPVEDYKEARLYNIISSSLTSNVFHLSRTSCKYTDRSYESKLIVNFRLIKEKQGREPIVIDEEVFMTNIPLMTNTGSFIFNGTERVVVTQLHRGHGVCFEEDEENEISKEGKRLYVATIYSSSTHTPKKIEFRFDKENRLYVTLDYTGRKVLATILLRALGITDKQIVENLIGEEKIEEVEIEELKKELKEEVEEIKITKMIPEVTRMLAEDIIDSSTGEIIYDYWTLIGEHISESNEINNIDDRLEKDLRILDNIGKVRKSVKILRKHRCVAMFNTIKEWVTNKEFIKKRCRNVEEAAFYVLNYLFGGIIVGAQETPKVLQEAPKILYERLIGDFNNIGEEVRTRRGGCGLSKIGRLIMNRKLDKIYDSLKFDKKPSLEQTELLLIDIIATIKYLLHLNDNEPLKDGSMPEVDDIDHLSLRHVRPVGEQLFEELLMGLRAVKAAVVDQIPQLLLRSSDQRLLRPKNIINNIPVTTAIKKFFATGELSQFLDRTNLLSDLTAKRRLSALGPGGVSRKHSGFEVRDIHPSSYGRMCPIETPEGANIGLITSLALYSRVNEYGLIETPYRKIENGKVTNKIEYMTADKEEKYVIAAADAIDPQTGQLKKGKVLARINGEVKYVDPKEVQYVDVSPAQQLSVSAALIPFLEHDDSNRALMGANMQRQAVPLLYPEAPLVATGIEPYAARDSGGCIIARNSGKVVFVDSSEIVIATEDGELDIYYLPKYERSNQDTCINYIPIVDRGQNVKKGEVIAGDVCTSGGQLALGKNVLVAFMSFEGYNFEDAILISERLVKEDVFTSVTITEFEIDARETKLGPEEITRDLPSEHITEDKLRNLDQEGIVIVGSEVKTDDILVGKIIPVKEQATTVEEKLLEAIFGKKLESGRPVPLEVPPGVRGKVIWRQVMVRVEEKKKKSEEAKKLEKLKEEFKKLKEKIEEEKKYVQKESEEKEIVNKYYQKLWDELEQIKKQQQEKIKKGDDLPLTVLKLVKVYIASIRKIQVGDKLSGRHGNKGVIAKILPVEDMPFLPDGTPVDVVISPLSIPSRMNIGQLLEAMLGWAAKQLNVQYIVPPFEGPTEEEVKEEVRKAKKFLISQGVPEKYLPDDNGKITLYDGRTGEPFMEKVFVGYMYIMKLIHMVEDKIHARSIGPYSLVTKQPLGGKAHFGGQRFGEMEVWSLESYGAAYTLQEFLTVKSDDVEGRKKIYAAIIKGDLLTYKGVPESFKVLIKELQALALQVDLLTKKYKTKESTTEKEVTKVKRRNKQ